MNRLGIVAALGAALLIAERAGAQPDPTPKDGKVTYVMHLTPTDTPKPLGNYHLLVEYHDRQPGEMLCGFLKCFMEQDTFFNAANSQQRHKWLNLPLAELPKDVREKAFIHGGMAYEPKFASLMVFMDQAARMNRVEWNEYFNIRKDGVYLLLPEIQKLRALADVLHLRLRGEIANGEISRAIVTIKTMFGMAKMLESHPTLIGNLVGIAVSTKAINGLEELIQVPSCPNLYWSLTDLPSPFFDLRTGLAGERIFLPAHLQAFSEPKRALSEKELSASLKVLDELHGADGPDFADLKPSAWFAIAAADVKRVAAARKRLIDSGLNAELVNSSPALQVAIQDEIYQYEVQREDMFKWMNLPYHLAKKGLAKAEEALKQSKTSGKSLLAPLFLPGVSKVKLAQGRTDQRLAYVRTLEAIRLHAHATGKLPQKLDEIDLLLPLDPISGKGFDYSVSNGVGILTGTNLHPGNASTNRHYEIHLRK